MIISGGGIHIPGRPAGGGAAAPVTPLTIFGAGSFYQWVRADLGVTVATGVSVWLDQSGNGKHYSQATAGIQPNYTASDGTLNGLPTIGNTAADTRALTGTGLILPAPGTSPYCILLVAIVTIAAIPGDGLMIQSSGGQTPYLRAIQLTKNLYVHNGNINAGIDCSVWSRVQANLSNNAGDLFKVGAASLNYNAGNAASGTEQLIGRPGAPTNGYKLWELIYLNRLPTFPEMAAYDAYVTAITAGAVAV